MLYLHFKQFLKNKILFNHNLNFLMEILHYFYFLTTFDFLKNTNF